MANTTGKKFGGRQKGTKNHATVQIKDLLLNNKDKLIKKAVEMAEAGNSVILAKLLDKLIPTLNHNENVDLKSTADYIKEYLQQKKSANLKLVEKEKQVDPGSGS